jgi:hypothetical protein
MEWAKPFALGKGLVRGRSLRHQLVFGNQCDDGVDLCVEVLDLFQVGLHYVACRQLLPANQIQNIDCTHETDFVCRASLTTWNVWPGLCSIRMLHWFLPFLMFQDSGTDTIPSPPVSMRTETQELFRV